MLDTSKDVTASIKNEKAIRNYSITRSNHIKNVFNLLFIYRQRDLLYSTLRTLHCLVSSLC